MTIISMTPARRLRRWNNVLGGVVESKDKFSRTCADPHSRAGLFMVLKTIHQRLEEISVQMEKES